MKRTAILLSLSLMLLSCSKEENTTIVSGDFDLSLRAELPEMQLADGSEAGTEITKASTQYTVRIKWAAGDKLSVINLTKGKILGGWLTADNSGTITSFSGSLKGTISNGDVIAYFYPAQENSEEQAFGGIKIDMSSQTGTTGGVPLCVFCTDVANNSSFSSISLRFSYLMSYMMIGLSDIPASASIKSVTLTNVTKSFGLSINSAKDGFNITPQIGDIVLSPGQTASSAGVKTVYAAIPESAAATRFAILETATTNFTTAFASAKLSNGTAYNTNVSGFLVDDLIPVDSNVRDYCLEHFDANGDGKLSMVEIAGVTEFPDQSKYPLPSDITRFNELEYFYGLQSLPTFKNQKRLESITIPKQIKAIPNDMFYGCTTLTKVILKPTTPPVLGSNAFFGLTGSVILVVADDSVTDYQAAEGWKEFFNNFRTESSQNDSSVEIDTEDEDSMGNERIDIIIK